MSVSILCFGYLRRCKIEVVSLSYFCECFVEAGSFSVFNFCQYYVEFFFNKLPGLMSSLLLTIFVRGLSVTFGEFPRRFLKCSFHIRIRSSFSLALEVLFLLLTSLYIFIYTKYKF